jgi:hypothetical protein
MTPVKGFYIDAEYFTLCRDGDMHVKYGYTWDGATWAIDSESLVKPSCIHDIFCELINAGLLDKRYQKIVDEFLITKIKCYWEWLRIHGTKRQKLKEFILRYFAAIRRWWIYRAVRIYQENKKKVHKKRILEVP